MQVIDEVDSPIKAYYERFPEEKDMAEAYQHRDLADYLRQVLMWYYRAEKYLILSNQVVMKDKNLTTSPDIAVIKDVDLTPAQIRRISGWKINPPKRPAPAVTIEISSESNYPKDIDLDKLPRDYAELGVKEYFAFDPFGYWGLEVQLRGWRNQNGRIEELPLEDGRIWSEELNCWIVSEDEFLWLEDKNRNRLLTRAEAEHERAQAELKRAHAEFLRAQAEYERAEAEAHAKDLERQRAEAERARAERLAAKLRELDIDPDQI
jgi:Uma2 family endonuclease